MVKSFLQNLLHPELVRLRLGATTKDAVMRELLDVLAAADLLKNRAEVERVILDRERAMSTGMENGIAIPHGKTDTVDNLLVAIGLQPNGVDFTAVDGQPSRIFVLVVSPLRGTGPHLRFMAEISKILRNPQLRARLLAATTPDEVVHLLVSAADFP